jgi:DNA-binding transcriptional LysR family regulator
MVARTQYVLTPADLQVVLALARTGTLAAAGERLGVDGSTVFRSLQRVERGLGQTLFARSRSGYQPAELALTLAEHAEQVETALESARTAAQARPEQVGGRVRITSTDTVLHALVAPALKRLRRDHPLLELELHAGNEIASLTRRDADIAVRATRKPPEHLVGRHLGPLRVALYAARKGPVKRLADVEAGQAAWIAVDDALPEHPSVRWRKRHFPKAVPACRVNSILTVTELVALGLGVGVLPIFLAGGRSDLIALTGPLDECESSLWLLTHAQSRHLRRVSAVFAALAEGIALA